MSKGSRSFLRHPAAQTDYFTVKQVVEYKQGINLVIADIESVEMKSLDTGKMEQKIAVHFNKWDQSWIPSKTMLQELGEVFNDNWDEAIGQMINLHAAKTGNPKFPLALRFRTATGKATPVDFDPDLDDESEENDEGDDSGDYAEEETDDQGQANDQAEEEQDEEQGREEQARPQRRHQYKPRQASGEGRQAPPPARKPVGRPAGQKATQQPAQPVRTRR
jgi:hypothetical protein